MIRALKWLGEFSLSVSDRESHGFGQDFIKEQGKC